jgi:metal-responsive CopG/Arc/MetJ family transcriptional regulator
MSKSFTLRFLDDDQDVLNKLAEQFGTDRSVAVRRALRMALRSNTSLDNRGIFTPVNRPEAEMIVHLVKGAASHNE